MDGKYFPLSKAELEKLAEQYPTPFYLYDEKGIIENARRIKAAFSGFPGYKQHFAVKALPNPCILKILADEGFGADCSSYTELLLAEMAGISGDDIMFTSNETPAREYELARRLGAVINLDDFTHIDFLEKTCGLPGLISMRFNPGPLKEGNAIIGRPEEAKYGLTRDQMIRGYALLKEKAAGCGGASSPNRFALHTMVASNELSVAYHIETARMLFELAAEVFAKSNVRVEFINLGGGVGIPYQPGQEAVDLDALTAGIQKAYDDVIKPAGLDPMGIRTEWGRVVTGPFGWLVARALHKKEIYRNYIGLDACMADLMRPALYGAYHHISIPGKEKAPLSKVYDIVGSLCENNDKFAVQRPLPEIETAAETIASGKGGDFVVIHDAGAHGRSMGFNYNGKLRCGELLLRQDGSIVQIRRPETAEDYFATLDIWRKS